MAIASVEQFEDLCSAMFPGMLNDNLPTFDEGDGFYDLIQSLQGPNGTGSSTLLTEEEAIRLIVKNFETYDPDEFDNNDFKDHPTKEHVYNTDVTENYKILDQNFCSECPRSLSTVYNTIDELAERISSPKDSNIVFSASDKFIATTSALVRLSIGKHINSDVFIDLDTPLYERLSEIVCARIQNRPVNFNQANQVHQGIPKIGQIYMERHATRLVESIIRTVDPEGLDHFIEGVFYRQFDEPSMESLIG
jgi:hypothetical protein